MKNLVRRLKTLDKLDLWFFSFILIFVILSLFLLSTSPTVDEGTHSLIALFFKDLINDLIKYPTISFSKLYDYTISYLVHYPKLSLYYPPLLHIMVSFFYRIFGISFFVGRFVVLLFSIATLIVMYKFLEKFFTKKIALLATILFSIMPMIYYNSITVMTDIPYMFFFMLSMYLYLKALESEQRKYFILAAISTSLGFLTKWNAILIIPVIFLYTFLEKRGQTKNLIFSIILISLIISPYLLAMWKTNLISLPFISSLQVSATAKQDPQFTTMQGWAYYLNVLGKHYFTIPLLIASIVASSIYIFKKEKYWKLLIVWSLIFYVFFTILSNKEPRYMIPLIPSLLIPLSALIVSQKKILIPLLIISFGLLLLPTWQLVSSAFYYNPDFLSISQETLKYEGNILIASEPSWFHSSQFIFTLASVDESTSKFVYRPCSLSAAPLDILAEDYGIRYTLVAEPTDRDLDKIILVKSSPNLNLSKEFHTKTTTVSLYTYNNYSNQNQYCNFICVLNATICAKYIKPADALK